MSGVNGKTPHHWGTKNEPETNSGIPHEMPTGGVQPPSIQEIIAKYVQTAVQAESKENVESWEDADDFTEDDPDTLDMTKYEFTNIEDEMDPHYDPFYTPEIKQEAPQEEKKEEVVPDHPSEPETASAASG